MLLTHKPELQELFELMKELSFKKGDFTLASGKKSNFYMDCRMTTLHGRGSYLIGRLLYDRIQELPTAVDVVGGMSMGADPMVSAVICRAAEMGQLINGFLVRKEAKGHGTGRQVEGYMQPWMRVVVLEDVVTTGGSAVKAIEAIRREAPQAEVVSVLSLVDRCEGGADVFKKMGIPYQTLFGIDAFLRE